MTKGLSLPERIKAAQRENERWILERIRREGTFRPVVCRSSTYNALDRLKAAGTIRYDQRLMGYVLAGGPLSVRCNKCGATKERKGAWCPRWRRH